jgi:hypothetical protein
VTAYEPAAWETFAAANAGAAAALAGLLFVGVSISIDAIVQSRRLAGRALEAFVLLTSALLLSVVVLVPDMSATALGVSVLVVGLLAWLVVTGIHVRSLPRFGGESDVQAPKGSTEMRIALGQAATIPAVVAGVSLLAEAGGGLYWLAPVMALSYLAALTNAWVLLIEIRR